MLGQFCQILRLLSKHYKVAKHKTVSNHPVEVWVVRGGGECSALCLKWSSIWLDQLLWNFQGLWRWTGKYFVTKLEILNVYHLGYPDFKEKGCRARRHGRWSGWSETKPCRPVSSTSRVYVSMRVVWVQILSSVNLCAQFLPMHPMQSTCPTLCSPHSLWTSLHFRYCCSQWHIYFIP